MNKKIALTLAVSLLLVFVVSCGSQKNADQQPATDATTQQAATDTTQVAAQPAAVETPTEKPAGQPAAKPAEKPAPKPAPEPVKTPTYVTIPASTEIAVTLVDSIDTDIDTTGMEFRATLAKPIVVEGHTLFAAGAEAKGILNKVVESGRLTKPAELHFSLTAIKNPDGQWVDIATTTIEEKKGSKTAQDVAMIGGGAVVGGVIGKAIDKKGSTEIGAAAGAAAGTVLAAATGKKDIFHGPGTEVTFMSSAETKVEVK